MCFQANSLILKFLSKVVGLEQILVFPQFLQKSSAATAAGIFLYPHLPQQARFFECRPGPSLAAIPDHVRGEGIQ